MNESRPKREPQHCLSVGQAVVEGYTLAIWCKACNHRRVVAAQPLYALCKARLWDDNFIPLSNRMRCKNCGGKLCSIAAVDSAPDQYGPIGVKSEAEYKALLRRLRD